MQQELRKRMKFDAEKHLNHVIQSSIASIESHCGHFELDFADVAKLIAGGRTDTLRDKLIKRMVNKNEQAMYDKFMSQPDLPLEEPTNIKAGKKK